MSTILIHVTVYAISISAAYGHRSIDHFYEQAQGEQHDEQSRIDTLPLSTAVRAENFLPSVPESVWWKGQQYGLDAGIDTLMEVIRHPKSEHEERESALMVLSTLNTQLQGRKCLTEVIKLYDKAETQGEKSRILRCCMTSGDARTLPFVARVMVTEKDAELRLGAAVTLAKWNIREGAMNLTSLFSSQAKTRNGTVGERAIEGFISLIKLKGWGCPVEEIRERIVEQSTGSRADAVKSMAGALRGWFKENEHRFPEWKPGDDLPDTLPPNTNRQHKHE